MQKVPTPASILHLQLRRRCRKPASIMGLEKVIRVPYNQRTIKNVLTSINSRNLVAKPWRRVFDVTAPIGSKITVTSRARITESDSRSRLIVANCILRSFDSNNVLRLRLKQRRRRPRSPDCALQRSLEFRCLSASQALSSHNVNTALVTLNLTLSAIIKV
jgi:hypothetical protein